MKLWNHNGMGWGQIRSVSFPTWAMKKLNKMKAGQVQDGEGQGFVCEFIKERN